MVQIASAPQVENERSKEREQYIEFCVEWPRCKGLVDHVIHLAASAPEVVDTWRASGVRASCNRSSDMWSVTLDHRHKVTPLHDPPAEHTHARPECVCVYVFVCLCVCVCVSVLEIRRESSAYQKHTRRKSQTTSVHLSRGRAGQGAQCTRFKEIETHPRSLSVLIASPPKSRGQCALPNARREKIRQAMHAPLSSSSSLPQQPIVTCLLSSKASVSLVNG
jgi:hypothetical protein